MLKLNKDNLILIYLTIYIFILSFIHNIYFFVVLFLIYIFLSVKILKKTIKSIFLFNISVTIGYIIQSFIKGNFDINFLILFNLRVFDITFMVFYVFSKINIIRAFKFLPNLKYLLVLSISQIKAFLVTFEEFKLSFKIRVIKKVDDNSKRKFIVSMLYYFLKKSLFNSKERVLALRARGFFD